MLRYKVGKLLSCYIGLPLGASFKSIPVYDLMVKYFKVRLDLLENAVSCSDFQLLLFWFQLVTIWECFSKIPYGEGVCFVLLWRLGPRYLYFLIFNKSMLDRWLCRFVIVSDREKFWGVGSGMVFVGGKFWWFLGLSMLCGKFEVSSLVSPVSQWGMGGGPNLWRD